MTTPKKFVFTLMPFDKSFDDIYTFGIKQTCTELNAYCERVDEQIFTERILDRIYNQISKADVIIADMTNRNPNVFYEVGYAHGIGKDVILLTQNSDDIPFDLKHFPHIIYDGEIKTLNTKLKTRLEWFLDQEQRPEKIDFDFGLEFLFDGNLIEEGKVIPLKPIGLFNEFHTFKIDIFNTSTKLFKSTFNIGLESDTKYQKYFFETDFLKTSSERFLITSRKVSSIYPKAFESIAFTFHKIFDDDKEPAVIDLVLKIFTNLELREIPFQIVIPLPEKSDNWLK